MNRGSRCPLNGGGLKILARGGTKEEMATFMGRVVTNVTKGKVSDEAKLQKYASDLLKGDKPKGLTIDWDDLIVELTQVAWIEGATVPETTKKNIRKKSDEIDAAKERKERLKQENEPARGITIDTDRLAAIQAKLRAGKLTADNDDQKEEEPAPAKPKKTLPKRNLEQERFDKAMQTLLKVWTEELGGKITRDELGLSNKRILFLVRPGEYSELLNREFGPKKETSELEKVTTTLRRIAQDRKKAESASVEKVTVVVTRNKKLFLQRCQQVGVTIPEKLVSQILGSKHSVQHFKDDKALITVGTHEMWIPDSEILIRLGTRRAPAKPTTSKPNEPLKLVKKAFEPISKEVPRTKRAPEVSRPKVTESNKQSLEDRVRALERSLVIAEKQKELYKQELAQLKSKSPSKTSKTYSENSNNSLALVSVEEFQAKVRAYPSSASKLELICSNHCRGMERISLFLWLNDEKRPVLSYDTVHPSSDVGKALACTLAMKYLQSHTVFRSHFN